MSFNFRVDQVTGRGLPIRALSLTCYGEWYGTDAFLANLDGRLVFENQVIGEPVRAARVLWQEGTGARLRANQRLGMELVAILSDSAIQFVEDNRRTGDLSFQVELQYQWHEAVRRDGETYTVGPVNWEQRSVQFQVPRSRWLQLLGEVKWTEIEIFELRTDAFSHFDNLPSAIPRLRQAEGALRNGDWNGVLAHCRAALESAAKAQARSDDLRIGFELLFAAAVPEHSRKRSALNDFVNALSAYAHLGRHESFPAMQITRSEAEFVYTTTLSLLSFLGRRLSKIETLLPNA